MPRSGGATNPFEVNMQMQTNLRETVLRGQTVVVLGGSRGIGFETAKLARAAGAAVILTGRDTARLDHAAAELGAAGSAAFDATDPTALADFFRDLAGPIDHVMVTAGRPHYARLLEMELVQARHALDEHLMLMLGVARNAASKTKPGGTLVFMGGADSRRPALGFGIESTAAAGLPALAANLALEVAPVRVNLIAAGFVNTALSASILGDQLEARRAELRKTLPIRRVVEPADVAALAVHIMLNTALTGATFDIDGGQQLLT